MEDPSSATRVSLLSRLRRSPDDPSAWDQFVALYGPTIRAWCDRSGLQEADAQDVTQDVLVRLALKLRTFVYDPSRSFRGWLRTLTRNAWNDFLADRRRQSLGVGSGEDWVLERLMSLEARDDLENRLGEIFDLELLELARQRVRQRVAEQTWEAFQLTAIDGHSGAEVAAKLGMKVTSIFMAKSNVKKMIRQEIELMDRTGP